MTDWIRVKDAETGHEYSIPAGTEAEGQKVLEKPGADRFGDPLPAKVNRPLADLTIAQLRELAEASQIDLGDASRKEEIRAAIETQSDPAIQA